MLAMSPLIGFPRKVKDAVTGLLTKQLIARLFDRCYSIILIATIVCF